MSSFAGSRSYLFTSESVTEGHPDKLCDQIADAILDAHIIQDVEARVACEVIASDQLIVVTGEITALLTTPVDLATIERNVIRNVGYDSVDKSLDYRECMVLCATKAQSQEVHYGIVGRPPATDRGAVTDERIARLGAGDQGMMFGFACCDTPEFMPLPITLAHRLCHQLARVRKDRTLPWLYPDGKAQVTVEYRFGRPIRVANIHIVCQHSRDVIDNEESGGRASGRLCREAEQQVIDRVIRAIIPPDLIDDDTQLLINPAATFVVGGPVADAGLTGRKTIVDTYGGMARSGGGALCGKDPTKVDRSGTYMARYVKRRRRRL